MSEEAEYILDRRRMKNRLNKWRFLTIAVGFIAVLAFIAVDKRLASKLGLTDQIARIEVSGVILESKDRAKMLKQIASDKSVKGLIVRFNSPGGTTTGGEALYTNLRKIARDRPVVAVFGTMATSAAYMSGVAAEHVVARGNSITGSVGVIMQWAEVSDLMGKLGVNMNEMKSGNLKAVPSPFKPLDEAGRALTQDMIDESHKWFVDLVVERRNIRPEQIPGFMQGRIFSGRQALQYGLIDEIGSEEQALSWLQKVKKVPGYLPVIDWSEEQQQTTGIFGRASIYLAKLFGFDFQALVQNYSQSGLVSASQNGGLISKWRP